MLNVNHLLASYGSLGFPPRILNSAMEQNPSYKVISNPNTAGNPYVLESQVNGRVFNEVVLPIGALQQETEDREMVTSQQQAAGGENNVNGAAGRAVHASCSYLEAVEQHAAQAVPVKNFSPPTLEDGNIVVTLEEEEIEAEEKECAYDVIGRISYLKGEKP